MKKTKTKKQKKVPGKSGKISQPGNPGEKPLEEKRPPGRPSVMTREIEDKICEQIAMGKSLVKILQAKGMPCYMTVCRHLKDTEGKESGFCERYARAREDQAEYLADEVVDVADTANAINANAVRLRVDARKWKAAKLKPKVYGDNHNVRHTGPDGGPVKIQAEKILQSIAKMTPEQRKQRLEELRSKDASSAKTG